MKLTLSWALGFKLCLILYSVGLIGAVLVPSTSDQDSDTAQPSPLEVPPPSDPTAPNVLAASGPLTRAVLDGIYFDIVRASGQGDQLEVELRLYNTGQDQNITPGRTKGILQPALFATVFDERGGKWYADQVRIANVTSTSGFLPQSKVISGVPTSMVLTFVRMPATAGMLQIRTIPQLEVPIVIGRDNPQSTVDDGQGATLVFRQIPVEF